MMTVKQVSTLTGISVRTLQFYDEIGLLKPSELTDKGYRLYDEHALETLQQILFFKELDFTLKEIKAIMGNPEFDQAAAFQKQRELIQMKRDRLNSLLGLLDRLIKGEKCMEFQPFDMKEYFRVLAQFKETHTDEILRQMGSMERFDEMLLDLKSRESEIADMAVKQYGSIENFAKSVENNFQEFLEHGPKILPSEVSGLMEKTEALTRRLTEDLSRDPASPNVQEIVGELIAFNDECNRGTDMGENYWAVMAELYQSNPAYVEGNDKKYGAGASKFIGLAIQAFLERQ